MINIVSGTREENMTHIERGSERTLTFPLSAADPHHALALINVQQRLLKSAGEKVISVYKVKDKSLTLLKYSKTAKIS